MRFGVMLLPRSLEETRSVAQRAEALGFTWISVADSPTVYEESYLHQLEVAHTAQTVSVGPMVSHLVVRHPVIVGNLLATLNRFTGGRAIGTLATGNSAARGLGLKPATIAELEEGVTAIRSYFIRLGRSFALGRSVRAVRHDVDDRATRLAEHEAPDSPLLVA
jgi:5,10-methylenetetrahydromethanopterin reductase